MTEEPPRRPSGRATGLVVPISLPPRLARLRRTWDHAALDGARPHVTVLYPFLPERRLVPAVRAELATIAASVASFDVRFERVRRVDDGLIWMEPQPADQFAALTARVVERWPDFPPYGGAFDAVIPHLTLVASTVAPLHSIEAAAREAVPFVDRVDRLELWRQDEAGRWQPRWRLPFRR